VELIVSPALDGGSPQVKLQRSSHTTSMLPPPGEVQSLVCIRSSRSAAGNDEAAATRGVCRAMALSTYRRSKSLH
jgi:hypothetical protein